MKPRLASNQVGAEEKVEVRPEIGHFSHRVFEVKLCLHFCFKPESNGHKTRFLNIVWKWSSSSEAGTFKEISKTSALNAGIVSSCALHYNCTFCGKNCDRSSSTRAYDLQANFCFDKPLSRPPISSVAPARLKNRYRHFVSSMSIYSTQALCCL